MQLVSENLVIIGRTSENTNTEEILVGRKKRGRFAGYDTFPGGKAEDTRIQNDEAARELKEETGIHVSPKLLKCVGKLLIFDQRPDYARFGSVFLYTSHVSTDTQAVETDELEPRWVAKEDPNLINNMPPDVAVWWPSVIESPSIYTITHVTYDTDGSLELITKLPHFAQTPGQIISSVRL